MSFTCDACNYTSARKYNYEIHLKSKKHKAIENGSNTTPQTCFTCKYCNKTLSSRKVCKRHESKCSYKDHMELKLKISSLEQQLLEATKTINEATKIINEQRHIIDNLKDQHIAFLKTELYNSINNNLHCQK